ncbi:MAG: hypothetical protein FJX19_10190 [Alphaproteobacteria bacterium]|nr:hypothetical protein [Alphaproteobacteria bacterium]
MESRTQSVGNPKQSCLAKLLVGSDWVPSEPSRAMALELLADERAFELSAEEAAEVLAARGAPMPDF